MKKQYRFQNEEINKNAKVILQDSTNSKSHDSFLFEVALSLEIISIFPMDLLVVAWNGWFTYDVKGN